jgi:hypothetical protein
MEPAIKTRSKPLLVILLFLTVLLISFAWISENPPAPDSSASSFSATRAIAQIKDVLGSEVAHPTGSAKNAEVFQGIERAVGRLGYTAERQPAFLCNDTNDCVYLENLVVRLPGQTSGPAVLLDAHYDSVAAGPGVADNLSGVAIALEIARQIHAGAPLKNAVVLLFDDAEEQGLLGSQAFVGSPSAGDVRWAVNLDARGVRGPSLMYQTSPHNAALMKLYGRATHVPVSNSLMSAVYEHLPSDTDFTNLRDHGIQGFNLAFLGGTAFYHRTGDNFAHLDPDSVQHQGEEALGLVRALATDPPAANAPGDVVYFDLFRHEIMWPRWLGLPLVALALALLTFAARYRAPQRRAGALLRGAVTLVVTVLLCAACSAALLWALFPMALLAPQFPAHPIPSLLAFSALAVAVAALVFAWVPSSAATTEYLVGYWGMLALLGAILSFFLFGASYIVIAPAFVAAVSLAAAALWGLHRPGAAEFVVAGSVCGAGVLWIPLLRLLYIGEGEATLPLIGCVLSAVTVLALPSLWPKKATLYRSALGALAVAGLAAIVAAVLPDYSAAAPLPVNLSCIQNGSGPVLWVTGVLKKNVSLIPELMRVGQFTSESHPQMILPWVSKQAPLYSSPAVIANLPAANLQILEKSMPGSALCVHARLDAPPEVDRIFLEFPPTASIRSMTIGGQVLAPLRTAGWKRFSTTSVHGGGDVSFCLDARGNTDFYLGALTYGLPSEGHKLIAARGDVASESQDGDLTEHLQHIELSPR